MECFSGSWPADIRMYNVLHTQYVHTNIRTYKHTNIQAYRNTSIQAYKHTNIQTYTHTNTQIYKHTKIQKYKNIHIQEYKNTRIQTNKQPINQSINQINQSINQSIIHACMHTYIHPSMHACIHTYKRMYTHLHIEITITYLNFLILGGMETELTGRCGNASILTNSDQRRQELPWPWLAEEERRDVFSRHFSFRHSLSQVAWAPESTGRNWEQLGGCEVKKSRSKWFELPKWPMLLVMPESACFRFQDNLWA